MAGKGTGWDWGARGIEFAVSAWECVSSLTSLLWSRGPHCAPDWGARSPGSHLHTAGGSLLCQGSQPRRYFIFSCSLRPEFSPGPASFREGSPKAFTEAQNPLPQRRAEQQLKPPNLTTVVF